MRYDRDMRRVLIALLAGFGLAGGITVGAAQTGALAQVQPGQWQLTEIGGGASRSVCIADPGQLLQLAHGDARCARTILDSDAKAVTVNYSCTGAGHGRTTLTVRGPQTLKLETQGMAGGAPFAIDYEAKRLGDCPSAAPAKPAEPARN